MNEIFPSGAINTEAPPAPAHPDGARRPLGPGSWYARPAARYWTAPPAPTAAHAFHAALPDYAPTRLVELPSLAAELGVGRVFVKDESSRLGLPAFKALGASWALHRVLAERGDAAAGATGAPEPVDAGAGVAAGPAGAAAGSAGMAIGPAGAGAAEPVTFVTATDGNHGRAVARIARLLGQRAHVFVSRGVHPEAVAAIEGEGARVTRVAGPYDLAVREAARAVEDAGVGPGAGSGSGRQASPTVLVQDSGRPGYERIPGWIVEGYATLFTEIDAQLAAAGDGAPDLVAVPVGVGSLAQAAVTHYRAPGPGPGTGAGAGAGPALLAVEPEAAACVLESLRRGARVGVATGDTAMAGLNCGTPSSLAWPALRAGLDAAVAVSEARAARAVRDLAALGVPSGPCGAASLAGVRAALTGDGAADRRAALGLGPTATLVLLSTEGPAANPHGQDTSAHGRSPEPRGSDANAYSQTPDPYGPDTHQHEPATHPYGPGSTPQGPATHPEA
ncbi:pyridoxal-phosphate dependent enzyme [Streptomyces buecherae]|uniref:Pyridoxal-phosphate dependent enzyme n=1 Tax=Streptomyces buecherae TaxID=2763006 RepID=A0A7H8N8I7_9ACTN|nr:pyridoxal-phosphate dependent enzyme [Streptomyces buecherae]QKW50666.1 pyridoxal-phosphate dependent enzyme [Streptomyces buecherae]